ncbi:cardiolipin synthase [Chitinimonas lacunae]|uniref:Cardiolipin synthase n=1 Tax=Chitinimonas lacunae TaxID=1963018 RepID=A0ABV8MNJ1_9NEIS
MKSTFPLRRLALYLLLLALLASIACLLSCRTLPDFQQTAEQTPQVQTRIQGRNGLLTAAKSEAILETLRRRGDTDILDRHIAFEEALLDTPLVTGNRVGLLLDGSATYSAMFSAIEQARDHINLETYIYEDDEVGQRFAAKLLEKQAQGVQVNLIYDSVGSLKTPRSFFERLRAAGVRVLEFNPINPLQTRGEWLLNNRDHRKLMVVDGRLALLGGINISEVYSRGSRPFSFNLSRRREPIPWRDTHIRIEGPVVADFQRSFLDTWQRQAGEPLPPRDYFPPLPRQGNELVRALASTSEQPHSPIYLTLLSAVQHAEQQIYLTNAYFVPDPQLVEMLCSAARRGVDVRLILPGSTDSWVTLQAGRAHYATLLDAGVKIYERRGALLHAKYAVIDGVWSTVGSTNLDWRSFLHNDELNAEVLGRDFARQMLAMFADDQAASDRIEPANWARRSPWQRFKEWASQLWSYWL